PKSTLFPYTTLFRSITIGAAIYPHAIQRIFSAKNEKTLKKSFIGMSWMPFFTTGFVLIIGIIGINAFPGLDRMESEQLVGMMANVIASQNAFFYRSEEHTSELQSRFDLVCRLL